MKRRTRELLDRVRTLAIAFVDQLEREGKMRGWRYEFVGVNEAMRDGEFGVVFDTYSPEGNLVDGPVIFLVNPTSGRVRSLNPD